LAHPLRQQILAVMSDGREAKPAEVAKEVRAPLGNVAYHFKVLADSGLVELVRTEPVRGAIAHIYKANMSEIDDLGLVADAAVVGDELAEILGRVVEASASGGLEDPRSQVSWSSLELDEQGQEEVLALLAKTRDEVEALRQRAAKRLNGPDESGGAPQLIDLALLQMVRPPAAGADD
jgi:hypothetical protein